MPTTWRITANGRNRELKVEGRHQAEVGSDRRLSRASSGSEGTGWPVAQTPASLQVTLFKCKLLLLRISARGRTAGRIWGDVGQPRLPGHDRHVLGRGQGCRSTPRNAQPSRLPQQSLSWSKVSTALGKGNPALEWNGLPRCSSELATFPEYFCLSRSSLG